MKRSVMYRLFTYIKPYQAYLYGAILAALFSVGLSLVAPLWIGYIIDYMVGLGQVNFSVIGQNLFWLFLLFLASGIFRWFLSIWINLLTYHLTNDLRIRFFAKLHRLPLSYLDRHNHGDLVSRAINDIEAISEGVLQTFTQLFTGVITIFGTLCFMLSIHKIIAVIVVLLTPLSFLLASFVAKRTSRMFRQQATLQGKLSGYANETIANQNIVRLFGYESSAEKAFCATNEELWEIGVQAQFYSSLSNPSTRLINNLIYTTVGIIGAIYAISGRLTIGRIASFLTYSAQFGKPFQEITGVLTQIQTALASTRRIFSVLDEEEEEEAPSIQLQPGTIAFEQVSFSYQKDRPLLQNFSLTVKPGETIAIVGPTGSGKTTILNLLLRFYEPDAGQITWNGTNIQSFSRSSLRKQFGMVLQDTWLFSGSVRDNIAYACPQATEEQIVQVAKRAYAHPFIMRLPQGYDTILNEDAHLSAGEKQLLCIARVLLADPPMVVLDEATSNIDTRTEQKIQAAFDEMTKGRTVFVVAHRLSTIRHADRILVLRDGDVVEQGSHETLFQQSGFYRELYESQFQKTE